MIKSNFILAHSEDYFWVLWWVMKGTYEICLLQVGTQFLSTGVE